MHLQSLSRLASRENISVVIDTVVRGRWRLFLSNGKKFVQSGDVKSDLLNCFEIVFDHCLYLGYFLERRRNYLSLPFFLKCLLKVIARVKYFYLVKIV